MCDCIPSTSISFATTKFLNSAAGNLRTQRTQIPFSRFKNSRFQLVKCCSKASSDGIGNASGELGFKDGENNRFELRRNRSDASLEKIEDGSIDGSSEEEDLDKFRRDGHLKTRKRRVLRRSNMVAKQVISVESALSLGFVSQLWVDTTSWLVAVVEVRPSLLSGDSERFLLQEVKKVGDVVLVEDESVLERDYTMVGLETLVGYKVVTPGRRNIGKVRGFNFDINSGAVESLELDSFGISIIPSSLVSTYALLIEDVLGVEADIVVVHEAAASHIQRLTKVGGADLTKAQGFLDNRGARVSRDFDREYQNLEKPLGDADGWSTARSSRSRKTGSKKREAEDEWELPMDYM